MADLIEPPPPTDLTQKPYPTEGSESLSGSPSAKIEQLIHLLKLTPQTEKSLVFSQFTTFIDKVSKAISDELPSLIPASSSGCRSIGRSWVSFLLIENPLLPLSALSASIPFVRFDGKMSAKRRQEAIARFSVPIQEASPTPGSPIQPSTRKARSTRPATLDFESEIYGDDSGSDDDFVMSDNDDADADANFSADESAPSQTKRMAKGKGKEKEKNDITYESSDENPRVMLLSLKAVSLIREFPKFSLLNITALSQGALGLNLTGGVML